MNQSTQSNRTVNINADIGEGFGKFTIGNDAALMPIIGSANIACGMHAGDPCTMARTVRLALDNGKSIGAHPGFNDIWGFGRRQIRMRPADLELFVLYQIGALQAIAGAQGARVTHVKPHGALNNMAHVDIEYARAIGRAIKSADPTLIYVANVGSQMHKAGEELGLVVAREAYVDRRYDDNGQMLSRERADAVITDGEEAARQVVSMVVDRTITSVSGKRISVEVDTLCVHGDEPTAVAVAAAARKGLEAAGVTILPLPKMQLGRSA